MKYFVRATMLVIWMTCLALSSTAGATSDLRSNLFSEVDDALQSANKAGANILAPENYEKAARYYRAAEEKLAKKRSIEDINEDLADATRYLRAAVDATRLAEVTLAAAIQARNDAESAEAEEFAADNWKEAERDFAEAARRLESGNVNSSKRKGEEAREQYRAAELAAIKNNYLSDARRLIKQADKDRVKKVAPNTLDNARALLQQAEKKLNDNRYDTDEARSLAREARYQARHALYLNSVLKQVASGAVTLENYALQTEQPLTRIGAALNVLVEFDQGPDLPAEKLIDAIEALQKESFELSERRAEILSLEGELRDLEAQLGSQSNRMQRQEEARRRFAQVEALFNVDEAQVYRQGGNVVIRMVGLNFDTGESVIRSEYFTTLRKVIAAIEVFPGATVSVEGHTDSFGSDAANLSLSEQRAQAVVSYLRANMPNLEEHLIAPAGYGETRPVANNETAEGRKRNRRIDLLIKPVF
jgi:outer membrane protein OmpA-like peptidoglycan-associated protein